ncbi:sigma-70 family RNA polymerase sigma factor [Nonomuraea fuscirosea]|uniref:RNA polymerase sigma factor n=1 Tax=Nonomuraea fuscirosea TaxID=1291556 RepID=UPI003419CCF3
MQCFLLARCTGGVRSSDRGGRKSSLAIDTVGAMSSLSPDPVADMEPFVRAAQQGDPDGLARLLQHEYPGMRAVAVGVLGAGPDAEDACQDAAVTALARIGDLRDPSKIRPWLHAIVRNNCRMILRNRMPGLVESAGAELIASSLDDPVAAIERSALRDLVWHGLRQLTPATLPVAMLRYFTVRNSYEEIAMLCGIPVGTVRSRLSDARRRLATVLPLASRHRHLDQGAISTERAEEAAAIFSAVANCVPLPSLHERWAEDLVMYWPSGRISTGLAPIYDILHSDYQMGATHRLTGVASTPRITIWEADAIYESGRPDGYPAAGTWLLRERAGRVCEVRLLYGSSASSA